MRQITIFYGFNFCLFLFLTNNSAAETYFFWHGSAPDSVSWAPFDWEGQGRTSGFATSVQNGVFFNHTPDAEGDDQLDPSLTFGFDVIGNQGAHHPTVLPGGTGTVSLWVYYDLATGFGIDGSMNSIYVSRQPGASLVTDNYIGVILPAGAANFRIVSKSNPNGVDGPAMKADDWNNIVFTDNGNSTTLQINGVAANLQIASGGNLHYVNIVDGAVQADGSIENGECVETFYVDDIVCTSDTPSGIEFIDVPRTSNAVTIDGIINDSEIAGANRVSWNGSSTERPGVHAQFYGQWQLPVPEDLTATVYLQNNGSNLFISIDVVDDVVHVSNASSWWEEDSTEVYIDHDNSNSTNDGTQISIRADNELGNAADYSAWLFSDSRIKPDNTGWQLELEIDMAARQLAQGQSYGFDVSINDSDGENEPGFQGAQEWLYASYETAYYNETYWGNIRILSTAVPVADWEVYE